MILVLDDGRAGHLNQILGVLKRRPSWQYHVVRIQFKNQLCLFLANLSVFFGYANQSILKLVLGHKLSNELLKLGSMDAIFSAGSYCAAVNYILGKIFQSKTVLFLESTLTRFGVPFDLNIIPYHDCPAKNSKTIKLVMSPHMIRPEDYQNAVLKFTEVKKLSKRPKIAFLIGGSSKHFNFNMQWFTKMANLLEQFCVRSNWSLLVTTSRRSPIAIEDVLKNMTTIEDLVLVHKNSWNPVQTYLGLCEHVLVTEDSFSMMSEALASKKPVTVLKVPHYQNSSKFTKTLDYMESRKWITFWNENVVDLESLFIHPVRSLDIPDDTEEAAIQIEKCLGRSS